MSFKAISCFLNSYSNFNKKLIKCGLVFIKTYYIKLFTTRFFFDFYIVRNHKKIYAVFFNSPEKTMIEKYRDDGRLIVYASNKYMYTV